MVIMVVISTMLVGGWISLQRSYAFTRSRTRPERRLATRSTACRARSATSQPPTAAVKTPVLPSGDAYVHPASERAARTRASSTRPTTTPPPGDGAPACQTGTTPPLTSAAAPDGDLARHLRIDGPEGPQLTRDTNNNGARTPSDRTIILATQTCVNTGERRTGPSSRTTSASSHPADYGAVVPRKHLRRAPTWRASAPSRSSSSSTPTCRTPRRYVDLTTTVRPRNAAAVQLGGMAMRRCRRQRGAGLILLIGITAALAILASSLVMLLANQQHATARERATQDLDGLRGGGPQQRPRRRQADRTSGSPIRH